MSRPAAEECLLCRAERLTTWYFESAECWVADCMVCATPMVVWRAHGLPSEERERELLDLLSKTAAERLKLPNKPGAGDALSMHELRERAAV